MSDRWLQYVRAGVENAGGAFPFALRQWEFLSPIAAAIMRAAPPNGRVLDVGCGAAVFPSLLAHFGYRLTGIDNDAEIVAYAKTMVEFFRSDVTLEQGTASDLRHWHGQFDVVYSLGVVEHFEPDQTVELLAEQARCAPVVIAVIPTKYTRYAAPITDERLYSRGQFTDLVRRAGLSIAESLVYGDVPTPTFTNMRRVLPKIVYRPISRLCSYGMGICVVGRRKAR